jgi:hypothetical protein
VYVKRWKVAQFHEELVALTKECRMPFRKTTQADREAAQQSTAALWNDQSLNEWITAFGLDEEGLTFAQIEQRASEAGKAMSRRVTEQLLLQRRQKMPKEMPCPQCGTLCRVSTKKRPITTLEGSLSYPEPASHCFTCRRDFFSGTSEAATERATV